jgi:hypothetical protein
MSGRPDELLERSRGLIALQIDRENSPTVRRAEWMRSPKFLVASIWTAR